MKLGLRVRIVEVLLRVVSLRVLLGIGAIVWIINATHLAHTWHHLRIVAGLSGAKRGLRQGNGLGIGLRVARRVDLGVGLGVVLGIELRAIILGNLRLGWGHRISNHVLRGHRCGKIHRNLRDNSSRGHWLSGHGWNGGLDGNLDFLRDSDLRDRNLGAWHLFLFGLFDLQRGRFRLGWVDLISWRLKPLTLVVNLFNRVVKQVLIDSPGDGSPHFLSVLREHL